MTSVITTRPKPLPSSWKSATSHHPSGAHKFVAIDGEGVTLPDGRHVYVLIRIGTNRPLTNPRGLRWQAIFAYLYKHYQPGTAYVGFYLGYDFTQIFRTMREDRARKLLTKAGIASRKLTRVHLGGMTMPVEADGWQFDFMTGRRLRIRPKICDCKRSMCKCENKPPWMYICDAGGFFQTSFLAAINPDKWPDPILSDEEYAMIREGKENRAAATLGPEMAAYNLLENDVMARLMERVDDGLRHLGVTLSAKQWFSPAQAAQAWMRGRVPKRDEIDETVPVYFREAARASFIAGWFEIFMHGRIPGIVYQYDINSAYPSIARNLPCLLHGKYTRGTGQPAPGKYVLVRADVTVPKRSGPPSTWEKRYIGSMMHRNRHGRISRPLFTSGYYWLHELEAAIRAGCVRVTKWHEWMAYDPCPCPSPLRELETLYLERLRQGKNSPMGRAARLVYNCVYGKLAQNVGSPQFMNFIYASLITAGCRTMILDAIATHPIGQKDVVQIATDAVYFMHPHPGLPLSHKLGEWDSTEHENMTVFKPGVYWDDNAREAIAAGKLPQFKARGVSARDMAARLADLDSQFDEWGGKPPPKIHAPLGGKLKGWPATEFRPAFAMVSALQALQRNDWASAGTLLHNDIHQSSNPGDKRRDAYYDGEYGVYRSEPLGNGTAYHGHDETSYPYTGEFGQENPDNQWSDENQDKYGINPDGILDQLLIDAMMPERKWTENVRRKGERNPYTARHPGRTVKSHRNPQVG